MVLSRINQTILIILASALLPVGGGLFAQTVLSPGEESRVWIEGRSNINEFSCNATRYEGQALITGDNENVTENFTLSSLDDVHITQDSISLEIQIPVEGFECGRQRMNRDLNDALKSDQHPLIHFELSESQSVPDSSDSGSMYDILITGTLTIAGTSRDVSLTATGEILGNGRFRVTGQKDVFMTDYNVTPPVGLLGLVRAENRLTVHFDLFAISNESEHESDDNQ